MTHLIEPGTLLTFCHSSDGPHARSVLSVMGSVELWRDLEVFHVAEDSILPAELDIKSLDVEKYLDHFLLLLPRHDSERHLAVVEGFFSYISDRYESFIDRARNMGNIRVLTAHLRRLLDHKEGTLRVIDFGCGTGLSLDVDASYDLLGVDRCPEMRALAQARGMRVLSMDELAALPSENFDGAFASYVFHLGPPEYDLVTLWSKIRPGGVVAANFHKGRGIDSVVAILSRLGAAVQLHEPSAPSRVHGSYVTFYKPGLEFSIRNAQ